MASRRAIAKISKLGVLIAFASALAFLAVIFAVLEMRRDAIDAATADTQQMAAILAEDVATSLATFDIVLREVADIARTTSLETSPSSRENRQLGDTLRLLGSTVSGAESLSVTDAAGEVIASSGDEARAGTSIHERADFVELRAKTVDGLYVSKPWKGLGRSAWTINFSRRIET